MNYGESFVASVRAHLTANGLKSLGQITAKVLEDLSQRHHAQWEKAKKPKATGKQLDEAWLKSLEDEPALQGVAIREELAKAQFWCKNNDRMCTRRFFVKWLNKADRKISHGGGKQTVISRDPYKEPTNWRAEEIRVRIARTSLMSKETWANVCAREWMDLSPDLRADIIRAIL